MTFEQLGREAGAAARLETLAILSGQSLIERCCGEAHANFVRRPVRGFPMLADALQVMRELRALQDFQREAFAAAAMPPGILLERRRQ